jgi:DNA-directed RNA polymerase I, II, and III subunit RPABC2
MSDNYENDNDEFNDKMDEYDDKNVTEKNDNDNDNDNENDIENDDSETSSSEESENETEANYCGYQYTTNVVNQNDDDIEDDILIYDENNINESDEKKKSYVNKEDRISKPFLTKYERARIIGDRTRQLIGGAKPMIKNYTGIDPKQIAILELNLALDKKNKNLAYLPFIVERPRPDGKYELWSLNELNIL